MGVVYPLDGSDVPEGGEELNERGCVDGVDGVVVDGFGAVKERGGLLGVVEGFGAVKDRLPLEEPPLGLGAENDRLLAAANAGATVTPMKKTTVTTSASNRRAQAQGRMVPLPSASIFQGRTFK